MGFSKNLFMQEREMDAALSMRPQEIVQTGYDMYYYDTIQPNTAKTTISIYQIGYPHPVTGQFVLLSSRTDKKLAEKEFDKIYHSKKEYRTGNKVLHIRTLEQVVTPNEDIN